MSLEATLTDIIACLRQGRFPNEQAISQGIELQKFNRRWTQMNADNSRAACHSELVESRVRRDAVLRKSLSFPGRDRLSTSSFIPHPSAFSSDRRVYKLDLFERPPARMNCRKRAQRAQRTMRSLRSFAANSVTRHSTLGTRHSTGRNRRSQARAAIPEAWRELVQKGDELLVELLASAVESKAGVRADVDYRISRKRAHRTQRALRSMRSFAANRTCPRHSALGIPRAPTPKAVNAATSPAHPKNCIPTGKTSVKCAKPYRVAGSSQPISTTS